MKLSDEARRAIHDWRWGPHIEDLIERQEVVDAMIRTIMDTFDQLEEGRDIQDELINYTKSATPPAPSWRSSSSR